MDASIWLLAFVWSEAGWPAGAASLEAFVCADAGMLASANLPGTLVWPEAGLPIGAPAGACAKIIPPQIAAMADKRDRPRNTLAEVVIMEVNNVNSTAGLLASPVAETKLHAEPELTQAVKAVNGAKLFGQDAELSFVMDREAKRLVVRLVNKDTRKVIRQVPAAEVLRAAEELQQRQAEDSFTFAPPTQNHAA
jgi:uncharacterized FlaG/YvyC family protein